ncbi:MAG TPA: branched-chain amino acid ABC transporter permease [Nitrospirae bacterium]|nr:leucine/isoleucine/valine transporter permease subunit [bacterium BMS3Abin08]HDY70745.1 branched-chain amino acid ABC transporter permease [Nitrospirota bacterium]
MKSDKILLANKANLLLAFSVLGALLILPFFIESFYASLLSMAYIYIIAAIGVNILTGYTGLVTVGHGGFFAIGAYTSALMGQYLGTSLLPGLFAGGITAGIVGFLLGFIFLRLAGAFLAIGTLGFAFAIGSIINNWPVFEGREGITLAPNNIFGFEFGDVGFYYVCLITGALIFLFAWSIIRSAIGRAFMAVRDSERASEASGINLRLYKTLSFAISAAFTGVAGVLFAHHTNYVSSETFADIWISVDFLVAVVVGGQASLAGSVLGGAFVVLLPYYLSELRDFASILKGVVLILVLLFAPAGLASIFQKFFQKTVFRVFPVKLDER